MPTRLDRFHVFSNGNVVSNRYASAFESEGIRLAQNARVYGTSTSGAVTLSKRLAINTRNGIVVAEARQRISARQIGKGIAAVAGGPLGLALLGTAAIADLLDDASLDVQDGQIVRETGIPPGYDGREWKEQNRPNTAWSKTRQQACNDYAVFWSASNYPYTPGQFVCHNAFSSAPPNGTQYMQIRNVALGQVSDRILNSRPDPNPPQAVYQPASAQQIEDAIAQVQPSPEALRDLSEVGRYVPDPAPSDPAQVTNPQPSQDKTTTKTNPDGSTETTVCRTTGTVVGNSIRLQEACTITARDPQGNITGTSSTNTDQADPQPTPAEEDQNPLCELFPNIVACAELGEAEEDIPTETRDVTYQAETLFGGGTCPADQKFQFRSTVIPITNYAQACELLATYVRPIALLLAAFTALMIVARGMPE